MSHDEENILFSLAAEVVNFTSRNLFLTGKAGTGKTTFLKYIKEHCNKNSVVVAPTGVAAINAGGVTMHSFFQLPFTPYLPHEARIFGNTATTDRHALIHNIRFNREKIDLIQELELLIIDEVSMLRADMLDAIDEILRHFRHKRSLPFGGVQVLLIGDLFQLPPVVSDQEWLLMKDHYESPFFFSSKVVEEHPPLFIELKKVYRQKEEAFIHLLNQIRNNQMDQTDYELLHRRYRPDAMDAFESSITLTTHNRTADQINQRELQKLEGRTHSFIGEISGDFSEKALPAEMKLELKEGAQLMFIKNDPEPEKRYFNGKLATVKSIREDEITVILADGGPELVLSREKWQNIRYTLNREHNRIEEEELGSFSQYPVRLAWAITIHKSQGLTFDHAVIDAGSSFAAGQVYVALSRCRTLDGLVLLSRIHPHSVLGDERIIAFTSRETGLHEIEQLLADEKPMYAAQTLLRTFDLSRLLIEIQRLEEVTEAKQIPDKELIAAVLKRMSEKAKGQQEVSEKFMKQLEQILQEKPINGQLLNERVTKAKQFFSKGLHEEQIEALAEVPKLLKGKSRVRTYTKTVGELEAFIWKKLNDVQRVTFGEMTFEVDPIERKQAVVIKKQPKKEKGSSQRETLELYKLGKTIAEIAAERGMARSTIESHLSEFVSTGEVRIFDFVNAELMEQIRKTAETTGSTRSSDIKQVLGELVSYGQIRMVLNYLKLTPGSQPAGM